MSSVHYAPKKLERVLALRKRLGDLVREGTLTQAEANLAVAAAMHLGTPPSRVQCPDCKKVHRLVGNADRFTCCSAKQHSVWDCAVG